MKCRFCNSVLTHTLIDLGTSPPSNSYISEDALLQPETWYPLVVMVCDNCWLVQTKDFVSHREMFSASYDYFSSFSTTWVNHASRYVDEVVERFNLNRNSCVVEVAANDGYLLQFVKEKGIPCYGIEPTSSTARAAGEKGIEIVEEFFGVDLAEQLVQQNRKADLIIANNVLAHVPDINDFVSGFRLLLKPQGIATFEFQYLVNLIEQNQFDTIYHEHYSYYTLSSVDSIFKSNDLEIL